MTRVALDPYSPCFDSQSNFDAFNSFFVIALYNLLTSFSLNQQFEKFFRILSNLFSEDLRHF